MTPDSSTVAAVRSYSQRNIVKLFPVRGARRAANGVLPALYCAGAAGGRRGRSVLRRAGEWVREIRSEGDTVITTRRKNDLRDERGGAFVNPKYVGRTIESGRLRDAESNHDRGGNEFLTPPMKATRGISGLARRAAKRLMRGRKFSRDETNRIHSARVCDELEASKMAAV